MKSIFWKSGSFGAGLRLFFLMGLIMRLGATATCAADPARFTYVIVHGAFGGGWDWKTVDGLLTSRGHKVYRPTLTGLGERVHLASASVSLTTHIQDIVNLIKYESLSNVVLVGHSYGGMVITGVMDQIPDRLQRAIFLDAAVPNDGESFIALGKAIGDPFLDNEKSVNGFCVPNWLNPNKPPPTEAIQPWLTFSEPVSFKNPAAKALPVTFVFFLEKNQRFDVLDNADENSSYRYFTWRRVIHRGWQITKLKSDHLAERTHPKELASLLRKISRESLKRAQQRSAEQSKNQ